MIQFTVVPSDGEPLDRSAVESGLITAETLLGHVGKSHITIESASSDEMRRLNMAWRRIDRPTDILSQAAVEIDRGEQTVTLEDDGTISFSIAPLGKAPTDIIGQLVVCPPVVAEKAAEYGRSYCDQLTTTITHGVLHLAGYHHAD